MTDYVWNKTGTPGVASDSANWTPSGVPSVTGDSITQAADKSNILWDLNLDPASVKLGNISISGIFAHVHDADTCLVYGGASKNLTVNAGGHYYVGGYGLNKVGKNYIARSLCDPAADNATGWIISNGGLFTVEGDPDYYGGDGTQAFMRAVTVSYSGTTLIVEGDYSGWNDNDSIIVYRNHTYSSYNTDVVPLTINGSPSYNAGLDQTTITVDQTASGTWNAGGYAWNLTRNVVIGKYITTAEPWAINSGSNPYSFTLRPFIVDNNASNYNFVNINSASLQGIYRVVGVNVNGIQGADIVFRHTNIYAQYRADISSGIIVSTNVPYSCYKSSFGVDCVVNTGLLSCLNCTFTGEFCGVYQFAGNANDCKFTGNLMGLAYGFCVGGNVIMSGSRLYNNNRLFYQGGNNPFKLDGCTFGYDIKNVSRPNTYDLFYSYGCSVISNNCKNPASGLVSGSRNSISFAGRYAFDNYDTTANDFRIIDCFGNLRNIEATGTGSPPKPIPRDNSYDQVIEVDTLSQCNVTNPMLILNPDKYQTYCAADEEKEIRVYIQSTVALSNAEISLSAEYLDGTTNSSRTTVVSTNAILARADENDWSQYLSVPLTGANTPQISGYVYLQLELMKQINGAGLGGTGSDEVWVWPIPVEVCENPIFYGVIWKDGETQIYQKDAVDANLIAQTVWAEQLPGTYVDGSAGANLNTTINSRLATTGYTAPDNAGIAAIPTNPLITTDARLNNLDTTISSRSALTQDQVIAAMWEKMSIDDDTGEFTIYGVDGVTVVATGTIDRVGSVVTREPD